MQNPVAFILVFSVALAGLASPPAWGNGLDIRGSMDPVACRLVLTHGGEVDYGRIAAATLVDGQYRTLDIRSLNMLIECPAFAKAGLRATDNRAHSRVAGITAGQTDTRTDDYNFGLGTVAGKKLGGYSLSLATGESTADGVPVRNVFSSDPQQGWNWSDRRARDIPHQGQYFSFGEEDRDVLVSFKTLSTTIFVKPVLNKPEDLPLNQDVAMDGLTTFELFYF